MANTDKPLYVNISGPNGCRDLPASPPFSFHGVTGRFFPLRANMSRLTDFCDDYLNMDIPDSIVHFSPALPFVYLAVVNYGSMSPLMFEAQNVGWVSQDEVFFLIPLEIWRKEGRHMVFKEWACVSPFIFVNDSMSLTLGREVYGWGKVLGQIAEDRPAWMENPLAPTQVFGLRAPVFSKEYDGREEENKMLLEILRSSPASISSFPLLQGGAVKSLGDIALTWMGLAGLSLDILANTPIRGYRKSRSIRSVASQAGQALGSLLRMVPNPVSRYLMESHTDSRLGYGRDAEAYINQITLKQFRSPGHPQQACYQSLVKSKMGLDRVNGFGLLGDYNMLLGDPSGGYSIRLHEYSAYPIIDSLGLTVQGEEKLEDSQVSILKPVFPFWTDVDLFYDVGKTLCYRHRGEHTNREPSYWKTKAGEVRHKSHTGKPVERPSSGIEFNTLRGGSTQAIVGPFHFPDTTVQVYPLLASRDQLKKFVDEYLNIPLSPDSCDPSGLDFEIFGEYVYLMVEHISNSEGAMWSESNNIGCWADKSVTFCVPVKMFKDGEFHSIAIVSPYRFVNNNRAVISDREVNGRISVMSDIIAPKDVWLGRSGPVRPRKLLELHTEVLPALEAGVKTQTRLLLQINQTSPKDISDQESQRMAGEQWHADLLGDLLRKCQYQKDHPDLIQDGKILGLQLFTQKAPFNFINLKQYRDCEFVDRACIQAIVRVRKTAEEVYDVREIEEALTLRLTELPDFPIVSTLGLRTMGVVSRERVEHLLQPIRPFWMRLSVKEELGETLAWRVTEGAWELTAGLTSLFPSSALKVGRGILSYPESTAENLQQYARSWLNTALMEEADALRLKLSSLDEEHRLALIQFMETLRGQSGVPDVGLDIALQAARISGQESEAELSKYLKSYSSKVLYPVAELLLYSLDAVDSEIKIQRMRVREAKNVLRELDDVQLLIEPFLSDAWMRADRAGTPQKERKPDYVIAKESCPEQSPISLATGWKLVYSPPPNKWCHLISTSAEEHVKP